MPVTIIVDAANVIGSRPDGWWRDRAGAARRLLDQLSDLAGRGITSLPESVPGSAAGRWFPRFAVVLEGAAAGAHDPPCDEQEARLRVVRASGSGDDEIARLAAALGGERLVVTADRELRRRCESAGARVTGPRWLLGLL